ncbi:hypothetical protein BCV69DRAFT_284540 [Microstroma glucosiphilum]|uniref:Uncharacterized protein n=1 Tax=Pseudomicrostroma glucosiphilum TaxID=1684307 RepID=A0A316U0H9_9BASI|nr:hypothetical protein BCV69DRAFT_284540 [Pseudomicrostroma glucosiphilum]PWN18919.1 hypothetical protein BCV69DRAFT_284540 [Pseudomicrostroma glucosiphilum]
MAQQAQAYLDLFGASSSSSPSSSPASSSLASSSSPSASISRKKTLLQDFLDAVTCGGGASRLAGMEVQMRRGFAQALLNDLAKSGPGLPKSEHGGEQRTSDLLSLQCLKELSRLPGGSNVQSEPTNLRILLQHVALPPLPAQPAVVGRSRQASVDASDASSVKSSSSHSSAGAALTSAMQRMWIKGTTALRGSTSNSGSGSERRSSGPANGEGHLGAQAAGIVSHDEGAQDMDSIDWTATDTALRCLNNAIFLHETSRKTFAEDTVGGGRKVVGLLRNPTHTPPDIIFLGCRLLFFSTLFDASFNKVAVEEENLVEYLETCLRSLTSSLCASQVTEAGVKPGFSGSASGGGSVTQIKTALAEALKVVFNLGLYYPRVTDEASHPGASGKSNSAKKKNAAVLGEAWSDRLAMLLDPVIQLVLALPSDSLVPPMTNAIGVLLNYPIKPYRASWAGTVSQSRRASATSIASNGSNHNRVGPQSPSSPSGTASAKRTAGHAFHSRGPSSTLTSTTSTSMFTPVREAEHKRADGASPYSVPGHEVKSPLVEHLLDLLDSFMSRYFAPNSLSGPDEQDTDDRSTRMLAQQDGNVQLEEIGQPIHLLIRKLCVEDEEFRLAVKKRILPDDIDRTIGLDKRPDLTGRLVRLLSSISYPRLSRVAGELLLAICREEPRELVAQIGYGPCAGFLVSNGFGDAFPGAGGHQGGGDGVEEGQARIEELDEKRPAIDPITGTYVDSPSAGVGVSPSAPARSTSIRPLRKHHGAATSSTPASAANPSKMTEINDTHAQPEPEREMTEEEKEAEAERLFTLFDRLDRTGVIKVQNPLQHAATRDPVVAAKAELAQRVEERKRVEEEEREEEETLRELARWKAGRVRGSQPPATTTTTTATGAPAGAGAGAGVGEEAQRHQESQGRQSS